MARKQNVIGFKSAIYAGLLTGLSFGLLDCLARITRGGFQWFELYQTLMFHSVLFMVCFGLFSLVLRVFFKFDLERKRIVFSAVGSCLLILFFLPVTMKNLFFRYHTFYYTPAWIISVIMVLGIGIYFWILAFKSKAMLSIINNKKLGKTTGNIVFLLVVFTLVSLGLDLVQYNSDNFQGSIGEKGNQNIVFIVLDTVRADKMSLYGFEMKTTPNLDAFGEKAAVFDNAVSPSSWTVPVHSSYFTGKLPSKHGATKKSFFLNFGEHTLAEMLKENRYNTAAFWGGPYGKEKYGIVQGFNTLHARMDWYEYYLLYDKFSLKKYLEVFLPLNTWLGSDGERKADEINPDVFRWLDKNKDGSFFLFINYFDAHDPFNLGREYLHLFSNKSEEEIDYSIANINLEMKRHSPVDQEHLTNVLSAYYAELYWLDMHVAALLEKLEPLMHNTIIVIVSDHGEEFHDHGAFFHGKTLYEEVIHVPMLIYYPGVEPKRISHRVGTINLFATLLELTGIDAEYHDSVSLLPLINGSNNFHKDYVISELFGRMPLGEADQQIAFSKDEWKLLKVHPRHELIPSGLWNLSDDRQEKNNLYEVDLEKRTELEQAMISVYR